VSIVCDVYFFTVLAVSVSVAAGAWNVVRVCAQTDTDINVGLVTTTVILC
jgi:hypothetical protein